MTHKYNKLKVMVLDFGLEEIKCFTYDVEDETNNLISFGSRDGYTSFTPLKKSDGVVFYLKSKLDTIMKYSHLNFYMMMSLDKDTTPMFDELTEAYLDAAINRERNAKLHLTWAKAASIKAAELQSNSIKFVPYEPWED